MTSREVPQLAAVPARHSEHEPAHIGSSLRAQRERLGLTLREVARRIGVSASLISQIERDKVNPSVSTLYALVRELGLSMGDLFAADGDAGTGRAPSGGPGPAVRPDDRLLINLASGVTWERLTPSSDPCPEDSLVTHGGRE